MTGMISFFYHVGTNYPEIRRGSNFLVFLSALSVSVVFLFFFDSYLNMFICCFYFSSVLPSALRASVVSATFF